METFVVEVPVPFRRYCEMCVIFCVSLLMVGPFLIFTIVFKLPVLLSVVMPLAALFCLILFCIARTMKSHRFELNSSSNKFTITHQPSRVSSCTCAYFKEYDFPLSEIQMYCIEDYCFSWERRLRYYFTAKLKNGCEYESDVHMKLEPLIVIGNYIGAFQRSIGNHTFQQCAGGLVWRKTLKGVAQTPPSPYSPLQPCFSLQGYPNSSPQAYPTSPPSPQNYPKFPSTHPPPQNNPAWTYPPPPALSVPSALPAPPTSPSTHGHAKSPSASSTHHHHSSHHPHSTMPIPVSSSSSTVYPVPPYASSSTSPSPSPSPSVFPSSSPSPSSSLSLNKRGVVSAYKSENQNSTGSISLSDLPVVPK